MGVKIYGLTEKISNLLCFLIWFVIYGLLFIAINSRVQVQFKGVTADDMIVGYMNGIKIVLIAVIILSGLWWYFLVVNQGKAREYFECCTFGCAIFFICVSIIVAVGIYFYVPGIYDMNRKMHYLWYIFDFVMAFILNMYAFPPRNVQMVMMKGKAWTRWIVSLSAALVGMGIFIL